MAFGLLCGLNLFLFGPTSKKDKSIPSHRQLGNETATDARCTNVMLRRPDFSLQPHPRQSDPDEAHGVRQAHIKDDIADH